MKDFIVWDDIQKTFYDNKNNFYENDNENKCILLDGKVLIFVDEQYDSNVFYPYKEKDKLIPLWDTELKDINSKKIYAESSIVEFINYANLQPYQGYFKYDTYHQRMFIWFIEPIKDNVPFGYSGKNMVRTEYMPGLITKIRIIDTVQENKLGLIK